MSRGFIESTTVGFGHALTRAMLSEQTARQRGLLQSLDPRVRVVGLLALVLAVTLSRKIEAVAALFALAILIALLSRVSLSTLAKRVWLIVLGFTGVIALNNFADPISFLCGAIQAASRLNAEQSAKLCVQYLAPIVKNRQYNFLPIGENLFVGAQARPNEITYSEDWMRPDYVPPPGPGAAPAPLAAGAPTPPPAVTPPQAATSPTPSQPTNPADGLPGLMVPPGAGS